MSKNSAFAFYALCAALLCVACNHGAGQQAKQTSLPGIDSMRTQQRGLTADQQEVLDEFKGDTFTILGSRIVKVEDSMVLQMVIMDYSINRKVISDTKGMAYGQFSMWRALSSDSNATIQTNPYKDLNGIYSQVFIYKGALVTCDADDEGGAQSSLVSIISDSSIADFYQMPFYDLYKTAQRNNGITKYICTAMGNPDTYDTLEIKNLDSPAGLQIWKRVRVGMPNKYELKMPIDNTAALPMVIARNNLGAGSGELFIPLDPVNYDSLFNKTE